MLTQLIVAVLIISVLVIGIPAASQQSDDGYDDSVTPPTSIASLENEYIGVGIGRWGKWKISCPSHSLQCGAGQPLGGRFHIWCTGGDPTTPQDDGQYFNYSMVYPPPAPGDKWGSFQLMVDTYTSGDDENAGQRVWATFERGGYAAMMGDLIDGDWETWLPAWIGFGPGPYTPVNDPNVIIGAWYPTPNNDGVLQPRVRCEMEVRLLRDTVRFKWTIKNEDSFDHYVGMKVCADVMANPIDDGTLESHNIVSAPGYPLVTNLTVMADDDPTSRQKIPNSVEFVNSQGNPEVSFKVYFKEQGATPPDRVGIDDWVNVGANDWTYWYAPPGQSGDPFVYWIYPPPPAFMYAIDLGYGAAWKPRRLPAGQTTTFIHYIGLGSSSSDFTKPNMTYPQYVAAVQGPRILNYYTDELGIGSLDPNPFEITAYMYNTAKSVDLLDPSFTLILPSGLALDASEMGNYTKSLSRVNANTEGKVSWLVRPVGHPTGIKEYSVSYSANPVGGTTVKRKINIAATEWQPFSSGWQMISVPFYVSSADLVSQLGLTGAVVWEYDAYARKYQAVSEVVPGKAYWLKLSSAQTTSMAPDSYEPVMWAGTQGYYIDLTAGWNLIGNPFLYTVTLGEVQFYQQAYGAMNYDEAISRGLISSTVFWWDPIFRKYQWSSDRSVQIKPWQGYWVGAMQPGVTMMMTPSSQIGAALGGMPTDGGGGGPPGGP